jgi:serine/threonine protein kinase
VSEKEFQRRLSPNDSLLTFWSLGITVLEMINCGRVPLAKRLAGVNAAILHISDRHSMPIFPSGLEISAEGMDFVQQCCTRHVLRRSTARELLLHSWLRGFPIPPRKERERQPSKTSE